MHIRLCNVPVFTYVVVLKPRTHREKYSINDCNIEEAALSQYYLYAYVVIILHTL